MTKQYSEFVLVLWKNDEFFPGMESYTNSIECRERINELRSQGYIPIEVNDRMFPARPNSVMIALELRSGDQNTI